MKLLSRTNTNIVPVNNIDLARKLEASNSGGTGSNLDNISTVLMADPNNFAIADIVITNGGVSYSVGDIVYTTSNSVSIPYTVIEVGYNGEITHVAWPYAREGVDFTTGTTSTPVTGGTGVGAEFQIKTMYALGQDVIDGVLSLVPAQDPLVQMSMLVGYMRDILKNYIPIDTNNIKDFAITADKIDNATITAGPGIQITKDSSGIIIEYIGLGGTLNITVNLIDQNGDPFNADNFYLLFKESGSNAEYRRKKIDPITSSVTLDNLNSGYIYTCEIRNSIKTDDSDIRANDEYLYYAINATKYDDRVSEFETDTTNSTVTIQYNKFPNRARASLWRKIQDVIATNVANNHKTNYDTWTEFGPADTQTGKYQSMLILPDGKVLAVPAQAANFVIIDPSDLSITTMPYPTNTSISTNTSLAKYSVGALTSNNLVIIEPFYPAYFYIADPTDFSKQWTEIYSTGASSIKFGGGNLLPDGRFAPVSYQYSHVYLLDPINGKLYNSDTYPANPTGTTSSMFKWLGSVLLPNGKAVWINRSVDQPAIYQPLYDSAINLSTDVIGTLTKFGLSETTPFKYISGVLLKDERVLCMPSILNHHFMILDPINLTYTTAPNINGIFSTGCLLPDGRVFCNTMDQTYPSQIFDLDTMTATPVGPTKTTVSSMGHSLMLPDGRILICPLDGEKFIIVSASDGNYGELFDLEMCTSAYLNHF